MKRSGSAMHSVAVGEGVEVADETIFLTVDELKTKLVGSKLLASRASASTR